MTVIELPDGAEMEVPADAPRDEVRRRIGNYLKSLPKAQIDAIPTNARLAFGLGQGDVAATARKRMAENLAQQTQNEYADDMRGALQQGVRSVAAPAVVGATGLLTGGLGVLPAMALMAGAGGTVEYMAQTIDPSENVAGDIVKEAFISGTFEGAGRTGAALLRRGMAARSAAKGVRDAAKATAERAAPATVKVFAEKAGVPTAATSKAQRQWLGQAVKTAVMNDADEVMRGFGGAETIEQAGQRAAGVFDNIKANFLDIAKKSRDAIVRDIGDVTFSGTFGEGSTLARGAAAAGHSPHTAGMGGTKKALREVERAASRRLRPGVSDAVDVFRDAEKGAFKDFTLDEFLALRTDIGQQAAHASKGSAEQTLLWKIYGGMTEDVERLLASRGPETLAKFRRSSGQFAEYYGALKNEVFSRMFRAAEKGNGTAVVRELLRAAPSDISEIMRHAHSMAPTVAGEFRVAIQRAALGEVFGIAEHGGVPSIRSIGQNIRKFGPDRLDRIFGFGEDGATALRRVKELGDVVEYYAADLRHAPSLVGEGSDIVGGLIAKGTAALLAKAAGFKYIAARIGYDALSSGGRYLMESAAKHPMAFAKLKSGMNKVMRGVTSKARHLVTEGEEEITNALRIAGQSAFYAMKKDDEKARRSLVTASAPADTSPRPGGYQP